jgi:hypothetical protein
VLQDVENEDSRGGIERLIFFSNLQNSKTYYLINDFVGSGKLNLIFISAGVPGLTNEICFLFIRNDSWPRRVDCINMPVAVVERSISRF